MSLTFSARSASQPEVSAEPIGELTRAMARGDEVAYQKFFALYARRLFLYHLALTNAQEETAKDLLQQTMIRVAKYIKIFEDEPIFWSWLRNLARSCWIDDHRKKQRYWNFLEIFRTERIQPSSMPEPETRLESIIAELEPDERALLEEKYIQGLSVRTMSAARGCTEKSIESKLARLRQKLKERMTQ